MRPPPAPFQPAHAAVAAGKSRARLVVISGRLAVKVPLPDARKLLRVERYLARQARAAHNLGLPVLEQYYVVSSLALRLWRMERFDAKNA